MRGASVLRLVQCAGVRSPSLPVLLLLPLLSCAFTASSSASYASNDAIIISHGKQNNTKWVPSGHQYRADGTDVLLQTICEARCWRNRNLHRCIKTCLAKNWEKPGTCPNLIQINDDTHQNSSITYYLPCLNECKKDTACHGVQKCCRHHCGRTCQPAENLQNATGLLPIPSEIRVKTRKKRTLYIRWKPALLVSTNQPVFYILEERHQLGKLDNDLLTSGEWTICQRTSSSSIVLRNFVRPGRWYQFRIASVNENGTRGFSPAVTYISQIGHGKPKAPQVKVGPVFSYNGSLFTELHWLRPETEMPIVKFKVFWSKRLFAVSALDTVLVYQHSVSGDTNNYTIHDLEPNAMYFIQVQTITQDGGEILRSEKSGHVFNTTNYQNITLNSNTQIETKLIMNKIDNLQLQKLYLSKDENDLKARFTWSQPVDAPYIKYNITWWGTCKGKKGAQPKLTATTRHAHFDVYDLHFDCRYKVNVKEMHHTRYIKVSGGREFLKREFYDTSVTFTTPSYNSMRRGPD